MEDRVQIKGLGRLDGEYEIDPAAFTNRDLHTIKRISGVRAGELDEAWENVDNDLLVAFAIIGLNKAGVQTDKAAEDALWDAPLGALTFVAGEEEPDEASPPSQTPSLPADERSGSERAVSSGSGSRNGGDHLESGLSPTGSPRSDTSAESASVTSRT